MTSKAFMVDSAGQIVKGSATAIDPSTGAVNVGGGAVASVAGKTGAVTLATTDLTDGAALNTSVTTNTTNISTLTAAQSVQTIDAQTGTTYTLVLADAGQNVDMNNAGANTLTIPLNATVAFPVGTIITVTQAGAGTTTIAAAGGVTIVKPTARTLSISAQYETATLYKTGSDTWRALVG